MNPASFLPLGFSETPPASPWGINFGGGLNSTALIIEARRRGLRPDWILFADTGSERPGTLEHVERMRAWCQGWANIEVVRWIRQDGTFEALHDTCIRTEYLPSKAYGYASCTDKWKIRPMDRWRKERGFDRGAFAIGYDAGEHRRITKACERGDDPGFVAWYPLVAWGIRRDDCRRIVESEGMAIIKSSCFMCPNMKLQEWRDLKRDQPELFAKALEIEARAIAAGNAERNGLIRGSMKYLRSLDAVVLNQEDLFENAVTEDRCHHGGCFT